jgi:hypothetical protein
MAFAALATTFLDIPLPTEKAFTATQALERLEGWQSELNRLIHEVFVNSVLPAVRGESPMAALFKDPPSEPTVFEVALR